MISAHRQILTDLLRTRLLHLVIETSALKFSNCVLFYSKFLNISLPLLFVVFYKLQDLIILNLFVLPCQRITNCISCIIVNKIRTKDSKGYQYTLAPIVKAEISWEIRDIFKAKLNVQFQSFIEW